MDESIALHLVSICIVTVKEYKQLIKERPEHMVTVILNKFELFFNATHKFEGLMKSPAWHFHSCRAGILMKKLETVQEHIICEKQVEKILIKENGISFRVPGIPLADLSR